MNKIVIFGGSGFIGSFLKNFLLQKGYEVYAPSSSEIDVTNLIQLSLFLKEIQPNHVFNFAAIASLSDSDLDMLYKVNSFGTLNILRSLESFDFKGHFFNSSSAYVYGQHTPSKIREDFELIPFNHYATSKILNENFCNLYKTISSCNLRFFNVLGPGQKSGFLIPKILKQIKENSTQIKLGNIESVRDFIDIRDVCELINFLIEKDKLPPALNVASGVGQSIKSVVDIFFEIAGNKMKMLIDKNLERKNDNVYQVACCSLSKSLGFTPQFNIRETVSWLISDKAQQC